MSSGDCKTPKGLGTEHSGKAGPWRSYKGFAFFKFLTAVGWVFSRKRCDQRSRR